MKTLTIGVDGMTCSGCVASVKRVLEEIEGVSKADVSLEKRQATVEYDEQQVEQAQLRSAIEDAGYEAR